MRALLLCPASKRVYIRDNYCSYSSKAGDLWEPVDLVYQSGYLTAAGWEVLVLDAQAERLTAAACVERVAAAKPDAILTVTGGVCWESDLRQVAAIRRRLPDAVIVASADVLLGAAPTLLARHSELDAALLNYFSEGLVEYLSARRAGREPRGIAHIACRAGGTMVVGARRTPDVVHVPPPRHELFPLRRYRLSVSGPGRFATIVSSSGCNFACPFCVGSIQRLALRPAGEVGAEIADLRSRGIRRLYFYDPNFTSSAERVRAMCAAIRSTAPDAHWLANAHVSALDAETVATMAAAGCHTVMLGLESANDETLRLYGKGFTSTEAETAVSRCQAAGIRVLGYFIIGFPEEGEAEIRRTIEFARGLGLTYASFNLPAPVPGTPMHLRHGHPGAPVAGYDHSVATSIRHPRLSGERLTQLRREAVRRFYLRPGYMAARAAEALRPRHAAGLLRAGLRILRT
jgi:anaerobic magnesium-protoporphyrin IX monomethyl ester cyclase